MASLENKIILITGASSGIGKAMAEVALERGAKLALCARNLDKLKTYFTENEYTLLCKADVSIESDCENIVRQTIDKWGKLDILINNAGISMRGLFSEMKLAVLKEVMDINFWGVVYCTKYALPYIEQQKGIIVGISSIAGYRGLPARTGYAASKFALQGFLESLRTELLHTGVDVLWFCPGFTASNIRNVARNANGNAQGETPLNEDKLMSAEQAADIMMNAVENRKRNLIMTAQGKMTVWLTKLFPSLADKLVYKHFLKEPDSPLKKP